MTEDEKVVEFRRILSRGLDGVPHGVNEDPVALLLGGGVDAMSIGFLARSLGYNINVYSFQMLGPRTYDTKKAEEVANKFNWKFTLIEIDPKTLVDDFKALMYDLKMTRKTQIETVYPLMHTFPVIKEKYVLSGYGNDRYYGLSRKANQHYVKDKIKWDQLRIEIANSPNYYVDIAKKYDKIFVCPYVQDDMLQFMLQFDWTALNRPFEKWMSVVAFQEEFDRVGKWRKHLNYHLVAGIPVIFERLLDDPKINFRHRTRTMDLYRDWVKKRDSKSAIINI